MAARRGRPIRQIGVVRFLKLPEEIQTDIAVCMKERLERIYNIEDGEAVWTDDLRNLLVSMNPELPLLLVQTWLLVQADREVYENVVAEYKAIWESGQAHFPPVVIDSESEEVLCEGGHRSFSAHQAGIKEIEAVDVAAIDAEAISKKLPHPYKIDFGPDAEREYVDLQKNIQARIDELIDRLRDWPQVSGVVALWGPAKGHFRVKTQDWRVIFHVDEPAHTVIIDKIANRKEAYEDFHPTKG